MLYEAAPFLISFVILIAAILVFFAVARGRYSPFAGAQVALRIIVAMPLLLSAIALHFMRTNEATAMLPPIFPDRSFPSPASWSSLPASSKSSAPSASSCRESAAAPPSGSPS